MNIRPITDADIDSCIEVFYVADEALTAGFNLPIMPRNPRAMAGIFSHVLGTDPDRAWLAEDGGQVIGFGMAIQREHMTFLAFLFVRPEAQAAGLGAQLYDRCMPPSGYRAVCVWSVQPISAALYARNGLVPRTPFYTMTGRPKTPLPTLGNGQHLDAITQDQMDALDREVIGFARPVDHAVWQTWDRRPFGLWAADRLLGYGYAQPAGRLGPAVVRESEDLLPLIGALMAEIEPPEDWQVHVPGPAAEAFAGLLRAGMRFDGQPILYCSSEEGIDHSRYIPATFALP